MQTIETPIMQTDDVYSTLIQQNFNGLVNNQTYKVILNVETQNPNGGNGMHISNSQIFNVSYQELRIKMKPLLTELSQKSAIQLNWANLMQNPGDLTGTWSFINNFIKTSNQALQLGSDGVLNYSTSVMPNNGTFSFMEKLPKTIDGIFYTTTDNNYKLGYQQSTKRFYSVINGETVYSEIINITDNPFFFTLLSNQVVIRQYNIYNDLDCFKDFSLDNIADLPLDFIVQENN